VSPSENSEVTSTDGRVCSWLTDLDDGDIDYREAATMLWRSGFRGWVCNEGGSGDYVRSNVKYLSYIRWILDEWIPSLEEVSH